MLTVFFSTVSKMITLWFFNLALSIELQLTFSMKKVTVPRERNGEYRKLNVKFIKVSIKYTFLKTI